MDGSIGQASEAQAKAFKEAVNIGLFFFFFFPSSNV